MKLTPFSTLKMSVGFSKFLGSASQLMKRGLWMTRQQVRHSQSNVSFGPEKLNVVPSRWMDLQFREIMAFYSILVAAPLLAITTCCNLFIGSAKLKPIPEGYEPREDEYERHPITRWMMNNFYDNGQMLYETKLHAMWEQWNFSHRTMLMEEVRRVMDSEGDYAAWTYITSDAKYARYKKGEFEERGESAGTFQ